MSIKYYLVNCENKNPSIIIGDKQYIHIKAHTNGKQISIISQEELQIILDNWIDVENENLEKDIDNNDILQSKINLDKFIKE